MNPQEWSMLTAFDVVYRFLFLGQVLENEVSGSQIGLRRCAHADETGFKQLVLWNMKRLWQKI